MSRPSFSDVVNSALNDNRNPVVLLPHLRLGPDIGIRAGSGSAAAAAAAAAGRTGGTVVNRNFWRSMAPESSSQAKTVKREIAACECTADMKPMVCDECRRRSVTEWCWDKGQESGKIVLQNDRRDVTFNPGFSVGTAAVRGEAPLQKGYHHYWEIEMSTEVYGTDMMVGVGTAQVDLNGYSHSFVSLIGTDKYGWGLSYSGDIHHNGKSQKYSPSFGQYAVVGIHLDMWAGTLEFYLNRKPLGVAFRNLQNETLFPMISSTAARSGMNLICSRSYPSSLQMQALLSLGKSISFPKNTSIFKCLELPPGLAGIIKNNYWWIVTNKTAEETKSSPDCSKESFKSKKSDESPSSSSSGPKEIPIPIHFEFDGVVTRSRAKVAAEMAAGPADAAKQRSRSKSCGSRASLEQSSSSSSSSPSTSSSSVTTGGPSSSAGHGLQPGLKRRLDSRNSNTGPSKKK